MRALCMVVVKAGTIESVLEILRKKRKSVKQILVVTGRADICVLLRGNIHQINSMVMSFKKIKDVVSTETMLEVEVDMGW